jgi:glycosyltransferase involved in cell wall biosynthesis
MKCLNEQKTVKRCISDFHDEPWVDDIIVIDGGSSDYTVQELRQFGKVRVFEHKYLDYYHDAEIMQANIMMSYVPNGEIFFSLDFDERCNHALKTFLAQVNAAKLLPENADLVHIARRTVDVIRYDGSPFAVLGEDGWPIESHEIGQFPDFQPRLFRRSPAIHWVQSPHRCPMGYTKIYNLDVGCYIEHFEKDDFRDRQWIERRWLRPNAARTELGLTCDLHPAGAKPEYADATNPEFWKDRR